MCPVGESSGHLEGYVLAVEGNVEGVVLTDGKPFGSRGYRVRRHISQLKRSTFPEQRLQTQEKGQHYTGKDNLPHRHFATLPH